MHQDGDRIELSRDELTNLIQTVQEIERWLAKPVEGIFLHEAKMVLRQLKRFEAHFKIEVLAVKTLRKRVEVNIDKFPKLPPKVTGDGSPWIISTRLENSD
jgi:hypothetical protein